MLTYHLANALHSLKRNPILTALLVGGIALGICVSTAFVTLRHMYQQDFLPGKSDRVFYVRLDSWGKDRAFQEDEPDSVPDQITYRDARGLLRSPVPARQTPTFITQMFVHPDPKVARPYQPDVRLCFADLFDIFDMPFRYGGPWSKEADARPEQVIVLDDATNQKLFGGDNSVGRTVRLEERDFRVVGVLAPWRPPLRLFELLRNPAGAPEPIYIPFNLVEPLQVWSSGNTSGWQGLPIRTFQEWLASERVWVQYWVELPDQAAAGAYRDWLRAYIQDQKKLGRFARPVNFRLTTIAGMIEEHALMPEGVKAMSVVSLLFLAVCSLNLVGILLGKFLARIPEVSVRRALGASRAQIFWQHVIECELIGVLGGTLGVLCSLGILHLLAQYMLNGEALRLDAEMLLTALFLSLVAGLLAGLYPAWRICSVPPAMQLKVQ
ncbi:MAG TPA: ABC transporter permease [Candidatus Polarisedimenticolaceae bacterium]|nr:ABC transporter permease [Candidatus Polarisedimenticolaceae bacterium]